MTRKTWVTLRLPGARAAPVTSMRSWFQVGAVKQERQTASYADVFQGHDLIVQAQKAESRA
jgi:hypothetical protein